MQSYLTSYDIQQKKAHKLIIFFWYNYYIGLMT